MQSITFCCEGMNEVDQVQNYKEMYYQVRKKLQQLTQITELNEQSNQLLRINSFNEEIRSYQFKISQLQKRLTQEREANAALKQQIRMINQEIEEKQKMQLIKTEMITKSYEEINHQIFILRRQLKLTKDELSFYRIKQYPNERNQNIKDSEPLNNSESNLNILLPQKLVSQDVQQNQYQNLKNLILKQQKQIADLNQAAIRLSEKSLEDSRKYQNLMNEKQDLQRFNDEQYSIFSKIIQTMKSEIQSKQTKIQALFKNSQSTAQILNRLTQKEEQTKKLQKQIKSKQHIIERLDKQIQHYQQVVKENQIHYNKLHQECIQKDILCDKLQNQLSQSRNEIQWLTSIIQQLKSQYITSQLLKQDMYHKHKQQEQRYLKLSKLTKQVESSHISLNESKVNKQLTLSVSKLEQSVLSNSTLTTISPINSLKNSRLDSQMDPQQQEIKLNLKISTQKDNKANKYPYLNKSEFLWKKRKQNHMKHPKEITPFNL